MVLKGFWSFTLSAFLWFSTGPVPAQTPVPGMDGGKIEPKVLSDLTANGQTTFFIVLKEQADTRVAVGVPDWNDRGQLVFDMLTSVAGRAQQPIQRELATKGIQATSFWIINALKVTSSDPALIRELAARPDVGYLKAYEVLQLPTPDPDTREQNIPAVEWGIARINAPQVWNSLNIRGEGMVVANIDSGVQYTHPALVRQYRGHEGGRFDHNYNWFDPSRVCGNPSLAPCDNNGHGTHTMGTMVGEDATFTNRIGVAPAARWIAAKGCESRTCSPEALLAAGQWVLAPTDLNGQNPRPDLRPHVVNNSWGGGGADPFYRGVVTNWRNAGIFPSFAIGNAGPDCNSTGHPGNYDISFGVGATDVNDDIAEFSSRGPAPDGIVKPNASAPGVNVRSAIPGGRYANFNGTSMATPHVSGTVALMWSSSPNLIGDVTRTSDVLQTTARYRASTQCGAADAPNNVYGHGIIDALSAVLQATSGGTLQGRITDAASGGPIANAQVEASRGPTPRATRTDANGNYRLLLRSGSYAVTARAFGYQAAGTDTVSVPERRDTTWNLGLNPLPLHTVYGFVYSAADGSPIANAEIRILDTPLTPVRTNPDGFYVFAANVPSGTYNFEAGGTGRCLSRLTQPAVINQDVEVDFEITFRRDAFGYACNDSQPFNWVPGDTLLPLIGDDESRAVALPFTFNFYGQGYETIYVSTNGFANFLAPGVDYANHCLPNPNAPKAALYPLWEDLLVWRPAGIYTKLDSSDPTNRRFIIEWRDATFYGLEGVNVATFEILLEETTGIVTFQYQRVEGTGPGGATIGINDETGATALQYSCREAAVSAGKSITFFR